MGSGILKAEGVLRSLSLGFLVLAACLVGFDTQTKKLIFSIEKKATFKDLNALLVLVIVDLIAAAYNLLQLVKCFIILGVKGSPFGSYKNHAWVSFLLDQMVAYTCFSATSAATQASVIAITGVRQLQWMKLCNKFTKFCIQIGGGLVCGFVASLLLVVICSVSAFNLFRLYSPKQFFILKARSR